MKIGFVTCQASTLSYYFPTRMEPTFIPTEPPFTPDDQLAVDELRRHGLQVSPIVWGDPINLLMDFQLIIVRSPWDYMDNEDNKHQFIAWIKTLSNTGIPLANPARLMEWLLDKHYLADLEKEGVAVIPTLYLTPSSQVNLVDIFNQKGPFILKPCVSAAGNGLFYINSLSEALTQQPMVHERLINTHYMLQDYISEVTTNGEWSLIFIGGKYSHAVHKKPADNSIFVHAERGGSLSFLNEPSHSVIAFANHVYQSLYAAFEKGTDSACDPRLILYLRVDIIETSIGPVLIECEGVEPELFFRAQPQSENKFYRAILRILES